jgi:hypothetical protein
VDLIKVGSVRELARVDIEPTLAWEIRLGRCDSSRGRRRTGEERMDVEIKQTEEG